MSARFRAGQGAEFAFFRRTRYERILAGSVNE